MTEKFLTKPPAPLERPVEETLPHITLEDSRELVDAGAGPTFLVKKIEIEGNTIFDAKTLAPLVDVGQGLEVTLGVLTLMSQEISAYYAEHGYFLAQVYIPQQDVTDGVVKMVVSEGKIGKIEVTGNKTINPQNLIDRMKPVRDEPIVQERTLERTLMDLNELMGVTVRSVLRPGDLPGTSDLILEVTETPPYSMGFDADNFGSRFTGRNRFGVTGVAGNLLTLGDQLSVRGVRSDLGQNSVQPAYLLPVNNYGTTFKFSYLYSEQILGDSLSGLSAGGNATNFVAELAHPIYRSRTAQIKVKGGFESRNSLNLVLSAPSNRDEIIDTYFGVGGSFGDDFMGQNFFNVKIQRDIENFSQNPALISRTEGRNNIAVGSADFTRYQGTGFMNTYFIIKASGQGASDRAMLPDIFAIGGNGSVRGYPLAEFSGDRGFTASLEYVIPFPWKLPTGIPDLTLDKIFSISGFVDHGEVFVTRPQPGEMRQSITGAGGGLALNIPKVGKWLPASSFAFGYAVAEHGPLPTDGNWRSLYFNGSLTYAF